MNKYEKLLFLKNWYRSNRAALQTQPAQIAAIKADAQIEQIIRDLALSLFNNTLGGCGSCLADALAQLYTYPDEKMQSIMACKFILRRGVLLQDSNGILPMATTANLTDELAIAYLRDNPLRADYFDVLPNNWRDLIADGEKPATSDEKTTDDELVATAETTPQKPRRRARNANK